MKCKACGETITNNPVDGIVQCQNCGKRYRVKSAQKPASESEAQNSKENPAVKPKQEKAETSQAAKPVEKAKAKEPVQKPVEEKPVKKEEGFSNSFDDDEFEFNGEDSSFDDFGDFGGEFDDNGEFDEPVNSKKLPPVKSKSKAMKMMEEAAEDDSYNSRPTYNDGIQPESLFGFMDVVKVILIGMIPVCGLILIVLTAFNVIFKGNVGMRIVARVQVYACIVAVILCILVWIIAAVLGVQAFRALGAIALLPMLLK